MRFSVKLVKPLIILALTVATFAPRLLSLGQMLTVDENLWRGRGEQFIKGLASGHFEKTLTGGQPGVTTTWFVGLSYPWRSLATNQAAIATATGILILLITYGLTRTWGFKWGTVGGFFLALNPFLLAHSRLVHTDALFALFYLASVVYLFAALKPVLEKQPALRRHIVLSGFFGALALLTKIFAVILIPTILLILLIIGRKTRLPFTNIVFLALTWLITFVLSIFALWPALWVIPNSVVQYLTGRAALHASEGTHSGETTTMWWYYAREILFRLSPVSLLLVIPGLTTLWRKRNYQTRTAFLIVLSGLIFAIILSLGSDKSDRYVLFTVLSLDLLAVIGLKQLVSLPAIVKTQWGSVIVVTAVITCLALDTLSVHPYYLAYYNRLYPVEERHKLGWGEGLEQAAFWFEQNDPGAKVISYYPSVLKNWYSGEVDPLNHIDESTGKYVVLYRSAFERGEDSVDTDITNRYLNDSTKKPLEVITINRLPYIWIYAH